MRRCHARFGTALIVGLVITVLPVSGASAAHVARLDVRPAQVAPGGEVTVAGPPGWAPTPVSIRWNAVDGEVLATFETTSGGNASFGPGTVRIPNVPPGIYELVGTQQVPPAQTALRGVPARARLEVTAGGSASRAGEPIGSPPLRAIGSLREEGGTSTSTALLVGVGVFAITLAAGLAAGSALRRREGAKV